MKGFRGGRRSSDWEGGAWDEEDRSWSCSWSSWSGGDVPSICGMQLALRGVQTGDEIYKSKRTASPNGNNIAIEYSKFVGVESRFEPEE
jgi:hypothetical protein